MLNKLNKNVEITFLVIVVVIGFFAVANNTSSNTTSTMTGLSFLSNPHVASKSEGAQFYTEVTHEFRGPMHVYIETNVLQNPLKDIYLTTFVMTKQVEEYSAQDADFFYCKVINEQEIMWDANVVKKYKCYAQFSIDYDKRVYYVSKSFTMQLSSLDMYNRRGDYRDVELKEGASQSS